MNSRKHEDHRYRELAGQHGQVSPLASVNRDANNSGAFVGVTVWIARNSLRGFEGPCAHCCNGTVCIKDTGDPNTSEFGVCPVCYGDSRQ